MQSTPVPSPGPRRRGCWLIVPYLLSAGCATAAHDVLPPGAHASPSPFVASTARPFAQLMGDAMKVMDYGMTQAPMNGDASHDFVTMMIPHHQGAVDMAKAVLLYTQDPALRNLAQGIITEQQYEIMLMQSWLVQHSPTGSPSQPGLSPENTP